MDYEEVFRSYYTQFRGQATSIPVFGSREFTSGIEYANSAIRTWDRVDGQLWRELIVTAGEQSVGTWATVDRSIDSGTTEYVTPSNMRKPPAFVRMSSGAAYQDIETIPPQEAFDYSDLSSVIWFEGGANTGYTMHVGANIAAQYTGWTVDYVYIKKPTLMTIDTDPSALIVDMSDPEYMIQKMVELRARPARNGFLYKIASADAKTALLNMKIENDSGVWGNSDRMRDLLSKGQGWGLNTPVNDIRLP